MRHIPKLLTLTALAGLAAALTLSALAQEDEKTDKKGKNLTPHEELKGIKPSASAKGVSDVSLAFSLATYGRKNKSPVALLAAARILAKTPTEEAKQKPKTEKNKGAGDTEPVKTGKVRDNSPKALLAEALRMSKNDEHIANLAARVERLIEDSRGAVGGPQVRTTTLPGNMNDTYTVSFRGGEEARVAVVGSGNTTLDLYIYDQNGNLVTSAVGPGDRCLCTWVPIWTGPFRVRVVNMGFQANTYSIAWN
jgi:hypothetical protein